MRMRTGNGNYHSGAGNKIQRAQCTRDKEPDNLHSRAMQELAHTIVGLGARIFNKFIGGGNV